MVVFLCIFFGAEWTESQEPIQWSVTLYISCLLDLRKDAVIIKMPDFDSKYVSLMITGYDHYVNVPMGRSYC